METKRKNKRKVLLFLPILVLPFLALAFYTMGGGMGNTGTGPQAVQKGINTDLPDATFKKEEPLDKMGFYQQTDRDSANKDENGIKNVADRLGFNGQEVDPQTQQINQKLEALNREINRPAETANYRSTASAARPQPSTMKSDVDRLEALMKNMQEGKTEDPEMEQLTGMLDKIMAIQNPGLMQEKLKQQQPASSDSLFRAIPAALMDNQKAVQGAIIKLRLQDSIRLNGQFIPKGHILFGTCRITNQRLLLDIKNIRLGTSIIPVDLSVYSLDGMPGIDAPEAQLTDALNGGADDAIRNVQFMGLDQSIGAQVAGAGIEAAKGLFSKKINSIKVKLKAGQSILLRNNKLNQLIR